MKKLALMAAAAGLCGAALASSGGLDSNGCHREKGGGYHCHNVKMENIKAYIFGEGHQARSVRLVAQCQGKANEGVCFGYVFKDQ